MGRPHPTPTTSTLAPPMRHAYLIVYGIGTILILLIGALTIHYITR